MAASAPGPKTSPSPPETSPASSKSTLSPHPRLFPILVSKFLPSSLFIPLHLQVYYCQTFRPATGLRVSPRRNLSYPFRRSSLNSRSVNLLQPLCSSSVAPVLCFQQLAASFPKTPGVGVPLRDGRCTEAQKCPPVSPLPATLTHSVSRKSFPCHSYE